MKTTSWNIRHVVRSLRMGANDSTGDWKEMQIMVFNVPRSKNTCSGSTSGKTLTGQSCEKITIIMLYVSSLSDCIV